MISARFALAALAGAVGCAAHSHLPAGEGDLDALERVVARYAATYVHASRPSATFALDTTTAFGARRSSERAAELARIVGASTLAAGDSAVVCGELPSSCRMHAGYDAIVSFRLLSIDDGDARVAIELRASTGLPRVPIVWETRTVRFVRLGQQWEVDRIESIEVS